MKDGYQKIGVVYEVEQMELLCKETDTGRDSKVGHINQTTNQTLFDSSLAWDHTSIVT